MNELARIAESQEREKKEKTKAFAMSFGDRVRPFFVEFLFLEPGIIWNSNKGRGMINGSLVESFEPINPQKESEGTIINFVFGHKQFVAESLEQVTSKMNSAVNLAYG